MGRRSTYYIACVPTVQGCIGDKDGDVTLRSGTLDNDSRRPQDEPEEMWRTHGRERSRTPATVAEPDSTMSNDAGDQMMSADVEPTTSVDYMADERSGTEAARRCVPDAAANRVMSSSSNVNYSFRDRLRWERFSGFDAARATGSRSGTSVKQLRGTNSLESTQIVENKEDSATVRLMSRKRQCADTEAEVVSMLSSAPTADLQPADGGRKKHRPDPLVLSSSSAEHYGYPSWLRSPRVWNGPGPIPYTPPPMLSPARRAPGLFWAAATAQSQPLWSSFRQSSAFTCEYDS